MKDELQNVINHIPKHSQFPNGKLQISLPTTSRLKPGDILKVVNDDAVTKGWDVDEITIIRKSGYIACSECKKALHVHISSPDEIRCMNCKNENTKRTTAEVNIIE